VLYFKTTLEPDYIRNNNTITIDDITVLNNISVYNAKYDIDIVIKERS